jgi:hypothetical protein
MLCRRPWHGDGMFAATVVQGDQHHNPIVTGCLHTTESFDYRGTNASGFGVLELANVEDVVVHAAPRSQWHECSVTMSVPGSGFSAIFSNRHLPVVKGSGLPQVVLLRLALTQTGRA